MVFSVSMDLTIVYLITLTLFPASVLSANNCSQYVFVDSEYGYDNSSCLQGNVSSTVHCRTLHYVFTTPATVDCNRREVILKGNHRLDKTLTVHGVEDLIIRGGQELPSALYCYLHSDTGSGFVFSSVSNIQILNITFEGCGTLYAEFRSAVTVIKSSNILFKDCSFSRSVGRGISFFDVIGEVHVHSSAFYDNGVSDENKKLLYFGGGIYIEFANCSPGYSDCDSDNETQYTSSKYLIKDCQFEHNSGTQSSRISSQSLDLDRGGEGGGIQIRYKGNSSKNSIKVQNCTFDNNSAIYGGAISVTFEEATTKSFVYVRDCKFYRNHAWKGGGGALHLSYRNVEKVALNHFIVQSTEFVNNTAEWGGALSFIVTRAKFDVQNSVAFLNCTFIGNSARLGAAVLLKPDDRDSIYDGQVTSPFFESCSFISNKVDSNPMYSGIVDIESVVVEFSKNMLFVGSRGSAIVAKSAQIHVLESTKIEFWSNTATNGGAVALLGSSIIELYPGSNIVFDSNHASEYGGAIYAIPLHYTEYTSAPHKCFYSYISHSNDWNTTLTFVNNMAMYGYDVYAESLLPCAKGLTPFNFEPHTKDYSIVTGPANIMFTLPSEIVPGEEIDIHLVSIDELNQSIPSRYLVFIEVEHEQAIANSYISDDGLLRIRGQPWTEFNLTLQTLNTRPITAKQHGRLGKCPIGFTIEHDTCVCTRGMEEKEIDGIVACDMSNYIASLQLGYWIGCLDDKVIASLCPRGYCKYKNTSDHTFKLLRYCKDQDLCADHRAGQLCGKCKDGYSVYYHSQTFVCDECEYEALGILIYIFAELIPLTLLFSVILLTKVNLSTGFMQSILLFAQIIALINQIPLYRSMPAVEAMTKAHNFIIGFLNMDFFVLDSLSFCLWKGATALDNLAFHYLTTAVALLIVLALVMAKRCGPNRIKVPFKGIKIELPKFFKAPLIHCISTFLILPYTLYTVTSFQILSRLNLYGEGKDKVSSVVRLQGDIDYFGPDHLPYAIPALLVLIFLSLPPPLLLISYPLLWKIKAKLRRNVESENDTTIWPIRKLLPFIDSFQGVFRDNCRMFAGLLLLWRVVIAAIFALSAEVTHFFFLMTVAIFIIFITHAVVRPYRKMIYNILDTLMLGNILVVIFLSWLIFESSFHHETSNFVTAAAAIKLVLIYLPLVAVL